MNRRDSVHAAPTAKAEDLDEAAPAALPLCNGSNGCYPPRRRRRLSASPFTRISNYEKESVRYLHDLRMKPKSLMPEELRFGYISPNLYFNLFHAGFCAPYIANPNYLLLVDFRTREEYDESHLVTAVHYDRFAWQSMEFAELCSYSVIVFYDEDGTAAANLYTILHRAFNRLRDMQLDVLCILGGYLNVASRFPHLEMSRSKLIPWMPTLVVTRQIYLGRHEQAEERSVVGGLEITHVLSIGRSPESRHDGVIYMGLDGERDLLETFHTSHQVIQSVIDMNGRIFVHGVEGLNRSAAVIIAYLMRATPCLLDEAYFYLQVLRPFIRLDDVCLDCLMKYEQFLFGHHVTEAEELWF